MGCRDSFVQRVVAQRMFSTMIATAISDTSYPVRFGRGVCAVWFWGSRVRHGLAMGCLTLHKASQAVRQLEGAGAESR